MDKDILKYLYKVSSIVQDIGQKKAIFVYPNQAAEKDNLQGLNTQVAVMAFWAPFVSLYGV